MTSTNLENESDTPCLSLRKHARLKVNCCDLGSWIIFIPRKRSQHIPPWKKKETHTRHLLEKGTFQRWINMLLSSGYFIWLLPFCLGKKDFRSKSTHVPRIPSPELFVPQELHGRQIAQWSQQRLPPGQPKPPSWSDGTNKTRWWMTWSMKMSDLVHKTSLFHGLIIIPILVGLYLFPDIQPKPRVLVTAHLRLSKGKFQLDLRTIFYLNLALLGISEPSTVSLYDCNGRRGDVGKEKHLHWQRAFPTFSYIFSSPKKHGSEEGQIKLQQPLSS